MFMLEGQLTLFQCKFFCLFSFVVCFVFFFFFFFFWFRIILLRFFVVLVGLALLSLNERTIVKESDMEKIVSLLRLNDFGNILTQVKKKIEFSFEANIKSKA
jgi:hypothetical protein